MSDYLAVATLENISGQAKDRVVNTFAIHTSTAPSSATRDQFLQAIADFYTNPGEGSSAGDAVGNYIGTQMDRGSGKCTTALYDITDHLDGSPHGSPVNVGSFTLPAGQGYDSFPNQMCSVITLRGLNYASQAVEAPNPGTPPPATIRPRARRSGRLFIGPLVKSASNLNNTAVIPRPSSAFRTLALASVETLQQELNALTPQAVLCVWSRATASMHDVVEASMDDSFDVIRSRKAIPTTRTSRVFAPVPPQLGLAS